MEAEFVPCIQTDGQIERQTDMTKLIVKKVKVTLVQALKLCTGRTAHRGQ